MRATLRTHLKLQMNKAMQDAGQQMAASPLPI